MSVLGVDVSYYQRPPLPWAAWRAFGVQRAHIRASIGYLMDWAYPQHRQQARAAGLQTGVYHALLDHDAEIAQFDPVRAARSFVSLMQPGDELPAVVDVEALGIDDALLWAWISEYERLTDWPLMIYTSKYFWDLLIGPGRTRYSRFPFWVAQYSKPLTLIPDVAAHVAGHQYRYKAGVLPAWDKDLDLNEWYDTAVVEAPMVKVQYTFVLPDDKFGTSEVLRRLQTAFGDDLEAPAVVVPFDMASEHPSPVFPPVGEWWELRVPPYKLRAPNAVIEFFHADGTPFSPRLTRNVTWEMDVLERRNALLKVLDRTGEANDWWVRAADVQPAA